MKKKWIVLLCVAYGLLAMSFVVVDAKVKNKVFKKPVVMKKTLSVVKTIAIGTKDNVGKLLVKGEISNPLNGEKVVVNDDLSVKKDLSIYGNLKVYGNFEKVNVINTEDLADESVTTAKLAKKAVTTAKIDNQAVTTAKIDGQAVTTGKIEDGAVTKDKIENGAVTGKKVSSSAELDIKSIAWQAKSGVVNVVPADCKSEDNTNYTLNHLTINPSDRNDLYCGIHLPHNAIVTNFSVNALDNTDTWNFTTELLRNSISTGVNSVQTLAAVSTTGASGGRVIVSDSSIDNATIDNSNYYYTLKLAFATGDGNLMKFYNARINYTFTQPY